MPDHVEASELEQLVIGALAGERLERLERHLASCEACATRLAREARLEVMLAEVQAAAPRRRRRAMVWAAPLVAAVVVGAVLVLRRDDVPRAGRARESVVCSDGRDQLACIDDAHHHGLFVQYPGWAGPPPFGDRAPGTGPTRSPFEDVP